MNLSEVIDLPAPRYLDPPRKQEDRGELKVPRLRRCRGTLNRIRLSFPWPGWRSRELKHGYCSHRLFNSAFFHLIVSRRGFTSFTILLQIIGKRRKQDIDGLSRCLQQPAMAFHVRVLRAVSMLCTIHWMIYTRNVNMYLKKTGQWWRKDLGEIDELRCIFAFAFASSLTSQASPECIISIIALGRSFSRSLRNTLACPR